MTCPALAPVHADLPALLRQLQRQRAEHDVAGEQLTIAAIGAARLTARLTLVGALCLGGLDLAMWLVCQAHPEANVEDRQAAVAEAFFGVVAPDGAGDDEACVARALIDSFELQASASALIDTLRIELLISAGPLEQLPETVLAAMRHEQWALAMRGLVRLQQMLGELTPRNAFGWASMCLHKLGRYEEAEQWAMRGLGEQRRLIAIGPISAEAELLRRWGPHDKPVVSIVCITYNHERYIDSAMRGFLSQDCPYPFEILVHDDASTDRTQEILRRWQAQYPQIIKPVLQTQNQFSRGVRPFELLLARTRGEFVAPCEGDDFWIDPSKLRRQVEFLQAHPDFSCSAHNYLHLMESTLEVKPWTRIGKNFVLTQRQLMSVQAVLWLPTLVFRKTFDKLPPERDLAAIGDQFLTSYLGTLGPCAYFETFYGAVRRENEFSLWSPLPQAEKERWRVVTWAALVRLHRRLGQQQAVADLMAKIEASVLDTAAKTRILDELSIPQASCLAAA